MVLEAFFGVHHEKSWVCRMFSGVVLSVLRLPSSCE